MAAQLRHPAAIDRARQHLQPGRRPRYADIDGGPLTECLADVVARFVPYYEEVITPDLRAGKTVLIAAHGNSLRALVKYLDGMSDEDVVGLNIPTGIPLRYDLDADLRPVLPGGTYLDGGGGRGGGRGGESGASRTPGERPLKSSPAACDVGRCGPIVVPSRFRGAYALPRECWCGGAVGRRCGGDRPRLRTGDLHSLSRRGHNARGAAERARDDGLGGASGRGLGLPLGVVVVDALRDVVVSNRRAVELNAVHEGLLDDRVWSAAQRTPSTGEDLEVDLPARVGLLERRSGVAVQCRPAAQLRCPGLPWSTWLISPSRPAWRPVGATSWPTSVTS